MKKSILIICTVLAILSLISFGFINLRDTVANQVEISSSKIVALDEQVVLDFNNEVFSDFFYAIGTRFGGIKKGDLDNARSIIDFLPYEATQSIVSYKSVSVIILDDNKQTDIRETGNSDVLTTAQTKLLRSANYSTNILIRADCQEQNKVTGKLEDSYFTPHLTIVPETQAVYIRGKDALIEYLKENSKEETSFVIKGKLQSGKLYFTVNKEGTISNAKIAATSGYPSIDKKMIELITNAPGVWEPAKNSEGEKVEQVLVFSFGIMGC